MATPVTPISGSAAPAAPAMPASPAAPVAPAAPAPPAPPAPPAAPAPAAPVAESAAPAAPAGEPAAPAGPPQSSDFPQNEDGIEQFIEASERWKQEHPDEAAQAAEDARKAAEAAAPGAQPVEQAPKPADAPKPEDVAPAAAAATPKALDELFSAKPALKAAFDADPEAKGILMETARAAEAARPILDVVPTVEEARFAVETSSRYLNIAHGLAMAAENPEAGERSFGQFLDMFKMRDDKGQPIMQDGQPVMAESFDYLTQKLTTGALGGVAAGAKQELEALNKKLQSGVYPSEQLKEADRATAVDLDYKIKALDYVAELLKAEDGGPGELPALPADATPAQREFQARLEQQLEQAKQEKGQSAKARRVAERQKLETEVNQAFGQGVGDYVQNEIKARRERGEVIPDFILERKWVNPATQQETQFPDFAVRIMNRFTAKIYSFPTVAQKLRDMEIQGQAAKQARLEYFGQLRTKYLPGIVNEEIQSIHDGIRSMTSQSQARQQNIAQVARVEPQTGGTPAAAVSPQALRGEALEQQALANLQGSSEFQSAGRTERLEMLMVEQERIRGGGR